MRVSNEQKQAYNPSMKSRMVDLGVGGEALALFTCFTPPIQLVCSTSKIPVQIPVRLGLYLVRG